VFVYSSTATAGQYITGSGLSDSITGGAGADTIYGGDGADTIVDSAGADIYYLTDSSTATAWADRITSSATGSTTLGTAASTATTGTGVLIAATTGVFSTQDMGGTTLVAVNLNTAGAAIIYGMGTDDSLALVQSLASTAVIAVASVATATYVADNKAYTVRGTYTASTGGFAYSATGTDTLIIQDVVATNIDAQAILLVGVASVTAATTGGILTFAS
jgi:serralysin